MGEVADPLGDVCSAQGIALLKRERTQPDQGGPVGKGPLEEPSRLIYAALADPQFAQPCETIGRHPWTHRLEVAEGVGHVPQLEVPDWTASTITGWLEEVGLLSCSS